VELPAASFRRPLFIMLQPMVALFTVTPAWP
jgi:hypothetical protein